MFGVLLSTVIAVRCPWKISAGVMPCQSYPWKSARSTVPEARRHLRGRRRAPCGPWCEQRASKRQTTPKLTGPGAACLWGSSTSGCPGPRCLVQCGARWWFSRGSGVVCGAGDGTHFTIFPELPSVRLAHRSRHRFCCPCSPCEDLLRAVCLSVRLWGYSPRLNACSPVPVLVPVLVLVLAPALVPSTRTSTST